MPKPLVIVESPTKARTIARFLGDGYVVESSVGHIRDLPRSAKDIPAAAKAQPWSRLGVNVEENFTPLYIIPAEKKEQVKKLKALLKDANELYLATDEDREGESIAWHLLEVLKPSVPIHRMVFHEITDHAIAEALASPRALDQHLVNAQEARRILDRLYGYEVSPVLWKKVMPKLSAGRVQSPAARLLVERERERMQFRSSSYADLEATLAGADEAREFRARLTHVDGQRVAQGRDFLPTGGLSPAALDQGVAALSHGDATLLAAGLDGAAFKVTRVEEKPYRRSPSAPFMTSTLQQEAGRRLRFSSSRTMSVAQRLYERGFITYMRTDSVILSADALTEARRVIGARFGAGELPANPRVYRSKIKNAQEAHEAIRPAGDEWRAPEDLDGQLSGDELRLYELIWRRTLASQMNDAIGVVVSVTIDAPVTANVNLAVQPLALGAPITFATSGRVINAPGFFRIYQEHIEENEDAQELPEVINGQRLIEHGIEVVDHVTNPPARYTEATLVKALEERGIGRPSTYASIISTLLDRGYAWKKGQALVPSFVAFAVVQLMERYFADLVNYDFTAQLEDELDAIASGEREAIPYLRHFYFGDDNDGLKEEVLVRLGEIDARMVNTIPIGRTDDGREVVVRVGRYGPYVQLDDQTASLPDTVTPDELTMESALALLSSSQVKERPLGEVDGTPVFARLGRYGGYVQLGEGDSKELKRASLFPSMTVESVTLDEARSLLSLPRMVGIDPEVGQEIFAQNGRFGPYLTRGRETRSLDKPEEIFTIDLDEALAKFKEPKRRGARRASSVELGVDPEGEAKVVLRSGRFGPYVTDGKVNASLPRGMEPTEVTLEQALDLLNERKAKLNNDRG
ncbi:MAG: type I DNA topoisomerase [Ferrimicrobium sp.]